MKNIQLLVLASVLILLPTLLMADKVTLSNRSSEKLWVYIKKEGALGVDSAVKDYEKIVDPGKSITEDGKNMPRIWVLPGSLAEKKSDEARRDLSELLNLTQKLGNTTSFLTFDVDSKGKAYLYYGDFAIDEPFSVISISDVHTKEKGAAANEGAIQLRTQATTYLTNPDAYVQGFIFVGDSAGGYGKKDEVAAFRSIWYDPLVSLMRPFGKHVFLVPGNHDTYWESFLEPSPTAMLRLIQDKHGGYTYHFNIGSVQFINLGLYPSATKEQKDTSSVTLFKTSEPSLTLLANMLNTIGDEQPVVLMFHYPIHSNYSDWWHKSEKDALYETIKNYNVVAILVGHAHASRVFKFRDKCPVIQTASMQDFALLSFDPQQPSAIGIRFVDKTGKLSEKNIITNAVELEFEPAKD